MNLPNKLTVLRVIMIPFFLFFFFGNMIPMHMFWAFIIFVAAALTDALDGNIARKRGLVTNFGKLMDPLADKLLVTAAMVCILALGYQPYLQSVMLGYFSGNMADSGTTGGLISLLVLIVVLSRDLVVNAIRLVAASEGVVIAADKWGKLKTISQMVWLSMVLLRYGILDLTFSGYNLLVLTGYNIVESVLYFAMVVLTVGSGINYVVSNRQMFADA